MKLSCKDACIPVSSGRGISAESNGLDACRIVLLGVIAADHWQHWSVCAARSGPRTET